MKAREMYIKPDIELITMDSEEIIAVSSVEKSNGETHNVSGPARSKSFWIE